MFWKYNFKILTVSMEGYIRKVKKKTRKDCGWYHFECLEKLFIGFVIMVARRVPHAKQEPTTIPKHVSSPPVFSGVYVAHFSVKCFVYHWLSFCAFSFEHCTLFGFTVSDNLSVSSNFA
jgi:hypothetical protein